MKIAFIGAQGVGKTTLCRALLQRFESAHLVRETVRECPYPCDQGADFKTEWWVLSHSILAEQEARDQKHNLIITDRCLLDIAVYTKLIHESGDGRISGLQRQMIEEAIDRWLTEDPYDFMFFVKVDPTIWKTRDIDDGFRSVDMNWYMTLTAEFEKAIERFNVHNRTRLEVIQNDKSFDESLSKAITSLVDGQTRSGMPTKTVIV